MTLPGGILRADGILSEIIYPFYESRRGTAITLLYLYSLELFLLAFRSCCFDCLVVFCRITLHKFICSEFVLSYPIGALDASTRYNLRASAGIHLHPLSLCVLSTCTSCESSVQPMTLYPGLYSLYCCQSSIGFRLMITGTGGLISIFPPLDPAAAGEPVAWLKPHRVGGGRQFDSSPGVLAPCLA